MYALSIFTFILIVPFTTAVYCPHYCRCLISQGLRHVQCVGKGLISVELDVPRTVQWLQLSNNSIYELQDNIFEDLGLEHIMTLNLDNNAIQSIALKAFSGLFKLRFLDLSGNHLYYLPSGTFQNTPSLQYLFLQGNPLRYMPSNQPFLISQSILVLDISNCRLNYIPKLAFTALPSLVKLNISQNLIGSLGLGTFENMTKLAEVDFNENKLTCDSEIEELISWLNSKKIKLNGSPCQPVAVAHAPLSAGPMMERMMVLDNVRPVESEFDDYTQIASNDCICPDAKDEYKNKEKETGNDGEEKFKSKEQQNSLKHYNPLFLLLAFVNGVIVGIATALSFWVCSRWLKVRRVRNNLTTYTCIDYDGPPPAYSDLF